MNGILRCRPDSTWGHCTNETYGTHETNRTSIKPAMPLSLFSIIILRPSLRSRSLPAFSALPAFSRPSLAS